MDAAKFEKNRNLKNWKIQKVGMMRWKLDHQFENCPKLFEEKIPHWSTKNVAKKRSVANEPGDRWLSIHVIKLYDLKFKALLIWRYNQKKCKLWPKNSKKKSSIITSKIFYYIMLKSSSNFRHMSGIACFLRFRWLQHVFTNWAI